MLIRPLPETLPIVDRAWRSPFSTKSDFARENASAVAVAAQQGLITTRITGDVYGSVWRVTPNGLSVLWRSEEYEGDDSYDG